ncbi:kelch repeat protein [Gregarina niphandrodes]|uniref:Kelch repeat protein n=1 Tax=Gregarina niphandrodes TaxID=110365 RepID=A0A023BDH9_GRENI|nr:kelch repeat protein [Gregarina niphandrodes]EZG88610.1 kelch repeat protein [Gregarina niphandrodes]|eukprot:XP_011128545.1 kelch repeat protein [Gregarina niphandrodes]
MSFQPLLWSQRDDDIPSSLDSSISPPLVSRQPSLRSSLEPQTIAPQSSSQNTDSKTTTFADHETADHETADLPGSAHTPVALHSLKQFMEAPLPMQVFQRYIRSRKATANQVMTCETLTHEAPTDSQPDASSLIGDKGDESEPGGHLFIARFLHPASHQVGRVRGWKSARRLMPCVARNWVKFHLNPDLDHQELGRQEWNRREPEGYEVDGPRSCGNRSGEYQGPDRYQGEDHVPLGTNGTRSEAPSSEMFGGSTGECPPPDRWAASSEELSFRHSELSFRHSELSFRRSELSFHESPRWGVGGGRFMAGGHRERRSVVVGLATAYVASSIYAFGGCSRAPGDTELRYLDLDRGEWRPVGVGRNSPLPCSRWGHSMVGYRDQFLVLFGGDSAHGHLNDLWTFDLRGEDLQKEDLREKDFWGKDIGEDIGENMRGQKAVWTRHAYHSDPPAPRSLHSAAVWRNFLVVFGGSNGAVVFNDLWLYDLDCGLWAEVIPSTVLPTESILAEMELGVPFTPMALTIPSLDAGDSRRGNRRGWPSERAGQVACVHRDWLYIFGGACWGEIYNEVWRISLVDAKMLTRTRRPPLPWSVSRSWELVSTMGPDPSAKTRHAGTVVGDNRWMMYGGRDCQLSTLDLNTLRWTTEHLYTSTMDPDGWGPDGSDPDRSDPDRLDPGWRQPAAVKEVAPEQRKTWWTAPEILRKRSRLHGHSVSYDNRRGILVVLGGCDGGLVEADNTILVKGTSWTAVALYQLRPCASRAPPGSVARLLADHFNIIGVGIISFL